MKTKLKTLEDFKAWHGIKPKELVDKNELKAEAVKWKEKLLGEIGFVNKEGEIGRLWIVKFLDNFFNLTEEEIKREKSYSVWCGGQKCGTCKECMEKEKNEN